MDQRDRKPLRVGPEHRVFTPGMPGMGIQCSGTYRSTHLWVSNVSVNTGIACRVLRIQMSGLAQVSDLEDLGWDLGYSSLKLLGDVAAAGSGTAPWDLLMELVFLTLSSAETRGKGRGRRQRRLWPPPVSEQKRLCFTHSSSGRQWHSRRGSLGVGPSQGAAPRQKRLSKVAQQFFPCVAAI